MHIEERLNEGPRPPIKAKTKTKTKQKRKQTYRQRKTTLHPHVEYKFVPLVANQLWRANQHEHACFGLSSPPWSFPLHSGVLLYCMPERSPDFLCGDPFRHETFRPFFRRLAPSPLVLGCSRPLVGVDAEGSEIVQKTPHPLFSLYPTQSAPPTSSSNVTHFGSLVFSMRATNSVNKIRLLRQVASMFSLPVLISVSK